jgi:ABC-type cobalamin/Fe3+-siderophores transport system ATPase subunit
MFDMKTGPSMMYHRMAMIDATAEKQAEMKARIDEFISTVNDMFKDTGKRIEIEGNKFNILSKEQIIPIDALSSGEKQILLILLRVFLMDGKEAYVLLDEPENSLDISWQYELINTLVKLNPNAQYFITTHSPSIFGDGWGDKIIYMEDITTPVK